MTRSRSNACRRKTAKGQSWTQEYAERVAARVRRDGVHRVVAYECSVCGRWHIGKTKKQRYVSNLEEFQREVAAVSAARRSSAAGTEAADVPQQRQGSAGDGQREAEAGPVVHRQ